MMRRLRTRVCAIAPLILAISSLAINGASAGTDCASSVSSVRCSGAIAATPSMPTQSDERGHGRTADVVDCGPRQPADSAAMMTTNSDCAIFVSACSVGQVAPPNPTIHVVATYFPPGGAIVMQVACETAVGPPALPVAAIRAEAVRRAPQLQAATGGTNYLINAAVVYYLTGPAGRGETDVQSITDVTIPPFTLAGHSFAIRLHLAETDWDWGDGSTSSYTNKPAGQPYRTDIPCRSRTDCPDYIAHTYQQPGGYTISGTAHWTATYTLDGNPLVTPIPGQLTTTSTPRSITIHQAHAELVAE